MKILHIFDQIGDTTIPYELAKEMNNYKGNQITALTFNINIKNINPDITVIKIPTFNIIKTVYMIFSLLKNKDYQIINTHHTKGSFLIFFLHKIFRYNLFKNKIHWVHTVHNDYRYYSLIKKFIFRRVYQNATKIICNSNNTLHSLPEKYKCQNNIKVIYNGVNLYRVSKVPIDILNKEKIIFSANRFVPQKNLIALIDAFDKVYQKYPSWRLLLCGDGPLKPQLEKYAGKLHSSNNISFLGNVTREKVYSLMKKSSIYITPSLWEGFCNSNVEAMASGCALLTSNVEPLPEIANNSAHYFYPKDNKSLELELIKLLENKNLRINLGEKAIARAKFFDIKIAARNYLQFYGIKYF
jgi:glycosyltransferase involved in cell wall biosynthesis